MKSKRKNSQEKRKSSQDKTILEEKAKEEINHSTITSTKSSDYFSEKQFSEFELKPQLEETLTMLGYETATEVQAKTIPIALEGRDIIGSAKTGSGKSLAFLIPSAQHLLQNPSNVGVQVLILTPTRELAIQLYNLAKELLRDNGTICALIIGGANRKKEATKLILGEVKLIVATPGRLLDHMTNTKKFTFDTIKILIIDEADKILKIGFEEELREIIKKIPQERQTFLFSATITPNVEDLITLSVKNYVNIRIKSENPTVSTLTQGYIMIDADKKFLFLFTFIKKNINRKIIVFFSTCKEVEFFSALLNYVDVPVLSITGDYKQQKRSTTYMEFCSMEKGILLCTDVAQRGLDIPDVDWVIQYDPPHDPEEYLHRVGRTARGADKLGKALLMLLPSEIGFVRMLLLYKIEINEFDFPDNKLAKVQDQLEKLVNKKDHYLLTSAIDAYRAYLHAYSTQTNREDFNINKLDLLKLCKSFGLSSPPFVHLNLKPTTSAMRRKSNKSKDEFYSKGYNTKSTNDKRQFSR